MGTMELNHFRLLGRSGLRVSPLCLGTMTFGNEWGWGADKDESRRILDRYLDEGGNFIDTANYYTGGTSETFLGEFLKGRRESVALATKFTLNMRPGDPNAGGNHRKNIVQSLEASLRRLGTDYIDLYWLHAWDQVTPIEEVMRALDDQVRAGKILYVGVSDMPAWKVAQANTLAELRGLFTQAGLGEPVATPFVYDVEVEALLARSFPVAGSEATIRKMFADSVADDTMGLGTRVEDGQLRFTYRNVALTATR
jgi:aryl-alcohol dehydrogenase-like predicted oxidoreductase